MNNLVLYNIRKVLFEKTQNALSYCQTERNVILLTDDYNLLALDISTGNVTKQIHLDNPESLLPNTLTYLAFESKITLCTANALLVYNDDLESVGEFAIPMNACAACFDSTEQMITICDDTSISIFMLDYANTILIPVHDGSLSIEPVDSVYVGWGSADTQFKGKRNKQETVTEVEYKCSDLEMCISWRGSNKQFAVNYSTGDERQIKIFDSTCAALHRTDIKGLEKLVAFRPVGNLIACVRSTSANDQRLTFIEKNCLFLNDFSLEHGVHVKELQWSPCGTCLGVWSETTQNTHYIDLYICSNYDWLHKQRLVFKQNNLVSSFRFLYSSNNLISLEVLSPTGVYAYTFVLKTIASFKRGIREYNYSFIIDGRNLIGHALKSVTGVIEAKTKQKAIVEFANDEAINAITFNEHKHEFAIVDSSNKVTVFDYGSDSKLEPIKSFHLPDEALPLYYFYYFTIDNAFVAISSTNTVSNSKDLEYEIPLVTKEIVHREIDSNVLYVSNYSGEKTILHAKDFKIPPRFIHVDDFDGSKHVLFYLTVAGQFYTNKTLVNRSTTSVYFHGSKYCCLTINEEHGDILVIIVLNSSNIKKIISGGDVKSIGHCRKIERGAQLVTNVPNSAQMVFQLPRGNLEMIEVRAISLILLLKLVSAKQFKKAYEMMKFQSIGIDLLVDLDPHTFIDNIEIMLTDLGLSAIEKLMIGLRDTSALDKEDMKIINAIDFPNKRNEVYNAFCSALQRIENPHVYLGIMVVAKLQQNRENLPSAFYELGAICNNDYDTFLNYVESAVDQIALHVSYEDMYHTALSIFDIRLAEIIANKSEMDPKEYRPFFQKIHALHPAEQRFTILEFLREHTGATFYFLAMNLLGTFDVSLTSLLSYAVAKGTVSVLYENYPAQLQEGYRMICTKYASELEAKGEFLKSGEALFNCEMYEESSSAYCKAQQWLLAVHSANCTLELEKRNRLLLDVVMQIDKAGQFSLAAEICIKHLKNVTKALKYLLKGHHYLDAYYVCFEQHMDSFCKNELEQSMDLHYQNLHDRIIYLYKNYKQNLERLRGARLRLENEPVPDYEHGFNYEDTDSIYDAATTTHSTKSMTSSKRSEKSRLRKARREELKYCDTKPGSRYEDIALIREMHRQVTEAFGMGSEVHSICTVYRLINRDKDVYHLNLRHLLADVQLFMKESADEVWNENLTSLNLDIGTHPGYRNVQFLKPKLRTRPDSMSIPFADQQPSLMSY